eukprot:TRINITY_DN1192_c0_g1_i1.p1 TRINITY_DN1192_c0_g1~~TRINITY_DN1192_c0_g1_i1.p1  ORF type:complete len:651 (-),score=261.98 TRINITY_DN1192_c0_g1_i1:1243-3195(-)
MQFLQYVGHAEETNQKLKEMEEVQKSKKMQQSTKQMAVVEEIGVGSSSGSNSNSGAIQVDEKFGLQGKEKIVRENSPGGSTTVALGTMQANIAALCPWDIDRVSELQGYALDGLIGILKKGSHSDESKQQMAKLIELLSGIEDQDRLYKAVCQLGGVKNPPTRPIKPEAGQQIKSDVAQVQPVIQEKILVKTETRVDKAQNWLNQYLDSDDLKQKLQTIVTFMESNGANSESMLLGLQFVVAKENYNETGKANLSRFVTTVSGITDVDKMNRTATHLETIATKAGFELKMVESVQTVSSASMSANTNTTAGLSNVQIQQQQQEQKPANTKLTLLQTKLDTESGAGLVKLYDRVTNMDSSTGPMMADSLISSLDKMFGASDQGASQVTRFIQVLGNIKPDEDDKLVDTIGKLAEQQFGGEKEVKKEIKPVAQPQQLTTPVKVEQGVQKQEEVQPELGMSALGFGGFDDVSELDKLQQQMNKRPGGGVTNSSKPKPKVDLGDFGSSGAGIGLGGNAEANDFDFDSLLSGGGNGNSNGNTKSSVGVSDLDFDFDSLLTTNTTTKKVVSPAKKKVEVDLDSELDATLGMLGAAGSGAGSEFDDILSSFGNIGAGKGASKSTTRTTPKTRRPTTKTSANAELDALDFGFGSIGKK